MPEFTVIHIALLLMMVLVGALAGWIIRSNRSQQEKAAINSGWQDQMEAQRFEHQRLVEQNKSLMDQISRFQASNQDAKKRAKELSQEARKAYERRDELQREIKDVRSDLETVLSQRDKLQSDITHQDREKADSEEKDEKIFQLSRELESWHQRLPPLLERYRVRNEEAKQLEAELAKARRQVEELQAANNADQTQIEAVQDPDALTSGHGASNDPSDSDEGAADPDPRSSLTANDAGDDHLLRDDLKQIKGVGPAIERTLNEMGIYRLQQIADMTEYDIDRVAERLKGFHSRIYRENWIGQARELQDRDRRA